MTDPVAGSLKGILNEAVESFPHDSCLTCECFLGLVAQLRIDADIADRPLFDEYKIPRQEVHACLGCDPCPPGDWYVKYIHYKKARKIITL
jgi:hypothetical protein